MRKHSYKLTRWGVFPINSWGDDLNFHQSWLRAGRGGGWRIYPGLGDKTNLSPAMRDSSLEPRDCLLLRCSVTLCHSINCSPPGSSVPGILQARLLDWVAIFSFRGSSPPRNRTGVSYIPYISQRILYSCHLGSSKRLSIVKAIMAESTEINMLWKTGGKQSRKVVKGK